MTPSSSDAPPPLVPRWLAAFVALSTFGLLLSLGLCGVSIGIDWPDGASDVQSMLALGSIPAMVASVVCLLVSLGLTFVFVIVGLSRRR